MKILITGGTGFLGSYIVKELLSLGHEVIVLKRSKSSLEKIQDFYTTPLLSYINIDSDDFEEDFSKNKIDKVLHCATNYSRDDGNILEVADANLLLPIKLLHMCNKYNIKDFYNIDTFYALGIKYPKGLDSYVLSKKQFLEYGKINVQNYGNFNFYNLIVYHLFGPGDNPKKFIPFIISELKAGRNLDLTGGEQVRDFIYVEDAAYIIANIILNETKSGYNEYEIGTGKGVSLKDLVLKINKLVNSNSKIVFGALPYRENESMYEVASTQSLDKISYNFALLDESLKKVI